MTKDEALALALEALEINRVMAKDDQGNYTREVTPKLITAAITAIKQAQEPVVEVVECDCQTATSATGVKLTTCGSDAMRGAVIEGHAFNHFNPPVQHHVPEDIFRNITEEMHRAAVKVLHRANGLDGLPQRMVEAMRAVAPKQAITPETGNADTSEASAITSGNGQAQGPVYWECRHKESNQYTVNYGQWYPWERLTPRNPLETMEGRVAEIQCYIDRGYSYELRALYAEPAPKQAEPVGINGLTEAETNATMSVMGLSKRNQG